MRTQLIAVFSLLSAGALVGACGTNSEPIPLCSDGEVNVGGQCLAEVGIAANSVGYLPARSKRAALESGGAFEVVNASTGEVAFSGEATGPLTADGGVSYYVADFTELTDEGRYFVRAGDSDSAEFSIGEGVFEAATELAMLGLYGQRCGETVELSHAGNNYSHGTCHTDEAVMTWPDRGETRDDTGGWHDAGDYGKYVVNGAFAVAFLLQAWEHFPEVLEGWEFEIPEQGGDTPDILDEARVELEWLLKTQFDDGSFAHKVTALGFEPDIMPTQDGSERWYFPTSSYATGDAVAVLAAAARIYEEFDGDFAEECFEAADRGYEYLRANPDQVFTEFNEGGTGTYASGGDMDERAWAAVEMWETTGDQSYLAEFEESEQEVRYNFDWPDAYNLAVATYLGSEREGRDPARHEAIQFDLVSTADAMAQASDADPLGRGFDAYYWGSAGIVARMSHTLFTAHREFPNTAYLDGIVARLDHVLGRNHFARSYVTGLGANPPVQPHHRPSRADGIGAPWPGLLIGGPNGDGNDPLQWEDKYASYRTNEIAINWNTAIIYAFVAAQATHGDESAACVPDCVSDPGMGGAPGLGGSGGAGQ